MFFGSAYEGKKLNFGERADKENLREESELWKDESFFNLERKVIENQLKKCEEKSKISEDDNCTCGKIREGLKNYLPKKEDVEILENLKEDYGDDLNLKKEIDKLHPTRWLIGFIVAVVLETSVLVVQAIGSGGFNPVILLFAGMLALGGWLLGYGLGGLLAIYKLKKMHSMTNRELGNKPMFFIAVIIGIIVIGFVAVVRSLEDEIFYYVTFFLTIILGGVVAVLEAFRERDSLAKKHIIDSRVKLLRIIASKKHNENIKEYIEKAPENCREELRKEFGIVD